MTTTARPPLDRATAAGVHAGYLKPGMTVLDLTAEAEDTELTTEAVARGCHAIHAAEIFTEQLRQQAQKLVGKDVPGKLITAPPESAAP